MFLLLFGLLTRTPEEFPQPLPESLNMVSTWRWNQGTSQNVATCQGLTYEGTASSVVVLRNLSVLGRTDLPGLAQDIVCDSNWLFVANGSAGLSVLALAQPDHPRPIALLDLPGYAWSVAHKGISC